MSHYNLFKENLEAIRQNVIADLTEILDEAKEKQPSWDKFYLENGFERYAMESDRNPAFQVDYFSQEPKLDRWVIEGSENELLEHLGVEDALELLNLLETQQLYSLPHGERDDD